MIWARVKTTPIFKESFMKTALIALLVSFSAMASECYQRQGVPEVTDVTLPSEFCINDIKLKLEVFGKSEAVLSYSLDGVSQTKVISMNRPIPTPSGKVVFLVWGLYTEFSGGGCGDSYQSEITATLEMNKDATDVKLVDIKGSMQFSNDNCHSGMQEFQSLPYTRL